MPKHDYPWYIVQGIERPYTFEWYIGLSARAFYRWSHGQIDTERWSKLDHYLNLRAIQALERSATCARCNNLFRPTSMVYWKDTLYCVPCLLTVRPSTRKAHKHG